ncbi:MAG: hypothetical protein JST83_15515 [Bacteroidetes bacterium]|nr:hypothetical protein [Bacteroidota bacterium]
MENEGLADITFSLDPSRDIGFCTQFYECIKAKEFDRLSSVATGGYLFPDAQGRTDYLASIFYLVNCLQEFDAKEYDKWGRFPYRQSIQCKYNLIEKNIVQGLIDDFCMSIPVLRSLAYKKRKSSVFLTHDIDTVYGARNENGKYALTHLKWWSIPQLVFSHHWGTPDWMNMDRIAALEHSYGFRSAFYWLVHKDKLNSDYDIHSHRIQQQMEAVHALGADIGLHKSLRPDTMASEAIYLGRKTTGQRYHFLSFHLPDAWRTLEDAGITIDTSLGFSEVMGFRNSYGLPFMPYDLDHNRAFNVLEVPMQIMDRTFFNQGLHPVEIKNKIIDWLDQNKYNAIITINFHNNFLFDQLKYRGYHDIYETILTYFKEEGIASVSHAQLLDSFYNPDFYNNVVA